MRRQTGRKEGGASVRCAGGRRASQSIDRTSGRSIATGRLTLRRQFAREFSLQTREGWRERHEQMDGLRAVVRIRSIRAAGGGLPKRRLVGSKDGKRRVRGLGGINSSTEGRAGEENGRCVAIPRGLREAEHARFNVRLISRPRGAIAAQRKVVQVNDVRLRPFALEGFRDRLFTLLERMQARDDEIPPGLSCCHCAESVRRRGLVARHTRKCAGL